VGLRIFVVSHRIAEENFGASMNKSFLPWIMLILGFATAAGGCGGERPLSLKKTYPVSGKVTLNGKPVAFAIVRLTPKEGKGADATGYTGADGTFQLRTYSNTEMDGAALGEYQVEVEPFNGPQFMGPKPKEGEKPTQIPPESRSLDTVIVIDENTSEIEIPLGS
jgi:hypothetical protein